MGKQDIHHCTAFEGNRCIASGTYVEVVKKVKKVIDQGGQSSVLIFDDITSELVEVDFRGTMNDVLKSLEKPRTKDESHTTQVNAYRSTQHGPGRPKLGVVAREVTLLPRHWDWLNSQPGGASVTLRKLVEEARRAYRGRDKVRHSQEATFRFMSAMAGDLPGFEEATRALFAGDEERFSDLVAPWPVDIRDHARKLSEAAFQNREDAMGGYLKIGDKI